LNDLSIDGKDQENMADIDTQEEEISLPVDAPHSSKFILAKSYFDCREYDRCARTLQHETSPLALFLQLYAKYIAGEKRREEDKEGILSPKDNAYPSRVISDIVHAIEESSYQEDPFLLYLYGVTLRKQNFDSRALEVLVKSVTVFPYNWSAWLELRDCLGTIHDLDHLQKRLPKHLISDLFIIHAKQEFFQCNQELIASVDKLQDSIFFESTFLKIQRAKIAYHGLMYKESEELFDQVITNDPYCLDDLDIYSNILYVMEQGPKLAFLAQLVTSVDRFRSESCLVVANYYSLKAEHEKAITYYQRALILNRSCLSAWTLMGHEFVELKNTHAAIESYRRAVDANKRDFRAWYGLGQAYEFLEMHYYSLYYFQKAATLKPMDVRMWLALGQCYNKLDRVTDSIKAFKRALHLSDMDPAILLKIATSYEKIGDIDNAATYMKLSAAEPDDGLSSEEFAHARLWLARQEMSRHNWTVAYEYVKEIHSGDPNEVQEARSIARDAKSRMDM
jgi:anaphase-promoting complex subunit 8